MTSSIIDLTWLSLTIEQEENVSSLIRGNLCIFCLDGDYKFFTMYK